MNPPQTPRWHAPRYGLQRMLPRARKRHLYSRSCFQCEWQKVPSCPCNAAQVLLYQSSRQYTPSHNLLFQTRHRRVMLKNETQTSLFRHPACARLQSLDAYPTEGALDKTVCLAPTTADTDSLHLFFFAAFSQFQCIVDFLACTQTCACF